MFEEVKEIIKKYTETEPITEDSVLTEDLDLTSLDVVSIVGDFEDRFDIEVDDEEILDFTTVGDIVRYMEEHRQA